MQRAQTCALKENTVICARRNANVKITAVVTMFREIALAKVDGRVQCVNSPVLMVFMEIIANMSACVQITLFVILLTVLAFVIQDLKVNFVSCRALKDSGVKTACLFVTFAMVFATE